MDSWFDDATVIRILNHKKANIWLLDRGAQKKKWDIRSSFFAYFFAKNEIFAGGNI